MRAGLPPTTTSDGTSRVTTEPAPITTLSPTVTPGRAAYPHIVADSHRLSPFHPFVALDGVERMACGVYAYVRADKHIVADGHTRFVEYGKIEVGKKLLTHMYVASVVAAERLIDRYMLATRAEQSA